MQQVKVIGANGQLSLGKSVAGKMVLIDQVDDTTWVIKTGEFIPDSERWLLDKEFMKGLDESLKWAAENPPQDNFDEMIEYFEREINKRNDKD